MINTGHGFSFNKHLKTGDLQKHFKKKFSGVETKLIERKGPYLQWMAETEDDTKLTLPDHNFSTGIPTWTRTLNNFTAGLGVIAAQPNAGKSTVMISLMMDLLCLNDDILIVDLSFDDPEEKRYTQMVCNLSRLTYQDVGALGSLTDVQRAQYEVARDKLYEWIDERKFWSFSGGEDFSFNGKSIEVAVQTQEMIMDLMNEMRKAYPEKKIVFFIDAYNDIETEAQEYFTLDKAIKALKREAIQNEIVVMMAAHVRKSQDRKANRGKLTLDDIKGTKELEFSCVWASILVNEWKQNALADPLTVERGGKTYPVIAIDPQKSKVSTWSKTMFYGLDEFRCRIFPLNRPEFLMVNAKYNRMERD